MSSRRKNTTGSRRTAGSSRRGTASSRRGAGASRRGTNADERKEEENTIKTNIELPKASDFETAVPAMKVFPTMYETDVNDIKATFEEFQRLLKERKEQCLEFAQNKVDRCKYDNEDSEPIRIDVSGVEQSIYRCGATIGEGGYELERQKILVTDKLSELNACEEKLEFVNGDFLKTKSVKGLKSQIEKVQAKLKESEPILNEAKDAVKDLSKSALDSVRNLPKPNELVVKTVKACALLLGVKEESLKEWKDIKQIMKSGFINTLLSFEGADVDDAIVKKLEYDYLGRGNNDMEEDKKLTFERVKKASAVAGSLLLWLEAQLKYNEMLPQVTAQKNELKEHQRNLSMMDGSSDDLKNAIKILEKQIPAAKEKLRTLAKKESKMETQFEKAVEKYEKEKEEAAAA